MVLGREFVGTLRGAELVARVRADPELSHAQIRVLTDVRAYADLVARRLKAGLPAATAVPGELLAEEFDGTRRARRVRIQAEVEAQVDGMLGTLVDLSPTGAQVIGLKVVRPFQTRQGVDSEILSGSFGVSRTSSGSRLTRRAAPVHEDTGRASRSPIRFRISWKPSARAIDSPSNRNSRPASGPQTHS